MKAVPLGWTQATPLPAAPLTSGPPLGFDPALGCTAKDGRAEKAASLKKKEKGKSEAIFFMGEKARSKG